VPQWQGPLAGRFAAVDPFLREVGNALRSQLPFDTESSAYLQSVASVVSVHLARNYGAAGGGKPAYIGLAPHKLKRVQQYIADHIGEAIPVKQLAGTVHMSAYHFARMFRKATGQPPHLYITMQRVEHAKALLEEARQSLGEIAASVGFQTQSHFTEVFRKHSGMTPGAYRARCELSAAIGLRDPSATPTTSVTGADSASLR
jgi:AraC family transcriptional regulator